MRILFNLLVLFAVVCSAAWATDIYTWKPADLFVKRNFYVAGHILTGKPSDGAASIVVPTIAAGAGAGTGPTVAVSGNDMAGTVSVTTGSTPTASAVIATITYGLTFKTNSFVILEPANAATSALAVAAQAYPTSSTSSFALNTGSSGLAATTPYVWTYHVLGN